MVARRALPLLACLAVVPLGCSASASVVQRKFSEAERCPADRVRVVERGGDRYLATGCGQTVIYVCNTPAALEGGNGCRRETERNPAAVEPHPRELPPIDPRVP